MVHLMESKLLDLHPDKSCYIVMGEKKARKKLYKELSRKPILLYKNQMKNVKNNKYLGMTLSSTVCESITDTVESRPGLAKRAIYEIRTIVEDSQADSLGAIQLGLNLWQSTVVSSLFYTSDVWTDIAPKTMKKLEDTTSIFLSNMLGVSKRGCPTVSLYV